MKNIVTPRSGKKHFSVSLAFACVSILACSSKPSPTVDSTEASSLGDVHVIYSTSVAETKPPSPCPDDMVLVDGDYCPHVEEICLYNVDINGVRKKGPANDLWSCGEYKYPTRCLSETRAHMRFCIDKYEWPNKEGQVPQDWMTWYDAKKAVASVGKRLCTSHEWTLAAEGPDLHPLPYGDGYHRDNKACNIDRHFSDFPGVHIDVFQSRTPNDKMSQNLRAFLVPSGSMPNCVSDYGVHDMAGNLDEFVLNVGGRTTCPKGEKCSGWISGLKGGHVWHVRQASRPMTDSHYPGFGWYETSTRGCKDPSF